MILVDLQVGFSCRVTIRVGKPMTSFADRTDMLRAAYAALNRNDVAGFVADFDADIERVEPSDFPGGGTYRGLEAVKAHVLKARGTWAEGGCEPERFIVVGDRMVVVVHVRVRLKNEIEWREGRTGDVFGFRNDKIVEFRTFFDEQQAMEWAGFAPRDAS